VHYSDRGKRRDFNNLKDDLKDYFEANKVESVFELDQNSIKYLVDLNAEKHHTVMNLLKERGTALGLEVKERKVTELGEEEKSILSKRHTKR
jgi:hypothetical protein